MLLSCINVRVKMQRHYTPYITLQNKSKAAKKTAARASRHRVNPQIPPQRQGRLRSFAAVVEAAYQEVEVPIAIDVERLYRAVIRVSLFDPVPLELQRGHLLQPYY